MTQRGAPKWDPNDSSSTPTWSDHVSIKPIKGYADCRAALAHPGLLSQIDDGILRQSDSNLVFLDGAKHKRLRSLIGRTLPDRRSASESSGTFVEGLLGRLPASAHFDIVADFAVPIAEDMSLSILGLPAGRHESVAPLLSAMSAQFDPASDAAALAVATDAVHEFLTLIRLTIRQKAYLPGGSLDLLNQARLAGDLTLREMLGSSMMLAHASFQNSVNMISFAAVESMTNPALHEVMSKGGPIEQRSGMEEVFRLGSPARFLGRRSKVEMTIGSAQIAENDLVIPFLAEANRDPTIFEQPDEFDLSRTGSGHLAFGGGAHFCLGATVARAELLATIRGLTEKYRSLTFESATWGTNMVMFGPTSLMVGLAS
jgi:cytochrome P450